ncbi:MAG: hypothetical protein E7233_04350 [Lachnospiraceae bacterium]|nr:hypothetical protein [Lachnospiraceae bacterium]
MSKFKVGAGIADLDYPIEKYPAMSFSHLCEDKYDACNCRALAIETDDRKVLLLAFELSDIPEVPELEKKISEATGVPEDDVIITVTHNHTSPCDRGARMGGTDESRAKFREEYFEVELTSAINASKAAVASLQPAKYGYGEINSYIAANEITRDPQIGLYCDENGNGYVDNTLAIVEFTDLEGKPICFLMNHPCHATCAMGLDANGKYATSGNFTGITSRFLEEYYGGGAIALWTAGASGNLHPLIEAKVNMHYTDGYSSSISLPPGVGHMIMEGVGRQHAIDAIKCINRITDFTDEITLRHAKGTLPIENQLNVAAPTGGRPPIRPDYGMGLKSNQPEPAKPFVAPEIVDDPDHVGTLQMEVLSLGDVAFVGLGCELFCQIGRDIKNALPAKHTVVITHTPGYVGATPHQVGYIVDKSSAPGSHNPKLYRNLKPGFYDEMIVDKALEIYGNL